MSLEELRRLREATAALDPAAPHAVDALRIAVVSVLDALLDIDHTTPPVTITQIPESLGMRVCVQFTTARGSITLRNVTEIHYACDRRINEREGKVRVAFESDVHGTGGTWDMADIAEFEAVAETEKAEAF